nr:MAG TPA: hypothetical protein [Caudoviricetes sp.]
MIFGAWNLFLQRIIRQHRVFYVMIILYLT